MIRFIRATLTNGEPLALNPTAISWVLPNQTAGAGTVIPAHSGKTWSSFLVKESVAQILVQMGETEREEAAR